MTMVKQNKRLRVAKLADKLNLISKNISCLQKQRDALEKELELLEEQIKEETNYKLWKRREGKCFLVKYYTKEIEEDCGWYYIESVDKNRLVYWYATKKDAFKKRCEHCYMIDDFYQTWTEITKKDMLLNIKKFKDLTEEKYKKGGFFSSQA